MEFRSNAADLANRNWQVIAEYIGSSVQSIYVLYYQAEDQRRWCSLCEFYDVCNVYNQISGYKYRYAVVKAQAFEVANLLSSYMLIRYSYRLENV